MAAVLKPPGWEVDDEVKPAAGFPLSQFLQCTFPLSPVVHDVQHSYGIVHRLDVPSSGLLLVGVTYAGYYALKWQLDTLGVVREYLVSGAGVSGSRVRLAEPVQHRGRGPSAVCEAGKPSASLLRCVATARSPSGRVSMIAIEIETGRRHQIRAHLRHAGHPSVTDGKYNPAELWISNRRAALEALASPKAHS